MTVYTIETRPDKKGSHKERVTAESIEEAIDTFADGFTLDKKHLQHYGFRIQITGETGESATLTIRDFLYRRCGYPSPLIEIYLWWLGLHYRKWMEGADDKMMMTHPAIWTSPLYPVIDEEGKLHKCLPLVKRVKNNAYPTGWMIQTGHLQEGYGPIVYLHSEDNREPIEYDTFDDLIADGWRVD